MPTPERGCSASNGSGGSAPNRWGGSAAWAAALRGARDGASRRGALHAPGGRSPGAAAPHASRGAACAAALLALALGARAGEPPQAATKAPRLGRPLGEAEAARRDLDVFPDGRGLPPGRGDAAAGRALYAARCAGCHGKDGRGGTAEELAGAEEPLTARTPDKTIGSYWPYATTVFDFLRRAKPMESPGAFSADELYALTAYLLFLNGLVGEHDAIDATHLPRIRMPNRDGFVGVDAQAPAAPR
jgi:cytochrome c